MIDRSYLLINPPANFKTVAWPNGLASFYLSTQLPCIQKEIDRSQLNVLPLSEQIQLLEQAFQQQTTISITTLEGNQFATYAGSIHTLSASEASSQKRWPLLPAPSDLYHFY